MSYIWHSSETIREVSPDVVRQKNYMKSFIIFSLLLFPVFISCQLTTNDILSEEFIKSKDLFPKSIFEWFDAMQNDAPTLALVVKYKVCSFATSLYDLKTFQQ